VNDLQKMDDAELLDAAREARQIREHHCPAFAEQVPDALVDLLRVGAGLAALLDQRPQPVLAHLQIPVLHRARVSRKRAVALL